MTKNQPFRHFFGILPLPTAFFSLDAHPKKKKKILGPPLPTNSNSWLIWSNSQGLFIKVIVEPSLKNTQCFNSVGVSQGVYYNMLVVVPTRSLSIIVYLCWAKPWPNLRSLTRVSLMTPIGPNFWHWPLTWFHHTSSHQGGIKITKNLPMREFLNIFAQTSRKTNEYFGQFSILITLNANSHWEMAPSVLLLVAITI